MKIQIVLSSTNPEAYIKIAADDISKLRTADVYRVLESAAGDSKEVLRKVAAYIKQHRQDLKDEVDDILSEEFGA